MSPALYAYGQNSLAAAVINVLCPGVWETIFYRINEICVPAEFVI
jgi:hypothetical protein